MGMCSNCKHWEPLPILDKYHLTDKGWGKCPRFVNSCWIEVLVGGDYRPELLDVNTHEKYSCKEWEAKPDSFDELVEENEALKFDNKMLIEKTLSVFESLTLSKMSDSEEEDVVNLIKMIERIKKQNEQQTD